MPPLPGAFLVLRSLIAIINSWALKRSLKIEWGSEVAIGFSTAYVQLIYFDLSIKFLESFQLEFLMLLVD